MTTRLRRRKPSTIDAWRTLVMFFENDTSGELATLRTATENAVSERIRLQRSSREVSVPDISLSAFRATAGKGRVASGSQRSSIDRFALAMPRAGVIAFLPCFLSSAIRM